jgi:hypothetical protein
MTRRRAIKALRDYDDYRIFGALPWPGGLEDQPGDWVMSVRLVTQAKEWSDALTRLRDEYKQATAVEEKHQDAERIEELGKELEKMQKSHDERIESFRVARR